MTIPLTYMKFKLTNSIVDIPIYNIGDTSNSSVRINTSKGTGCYDLVNTSSSLPIRIMTSSGVKSINTIVSTKDAIQKYLLSMDGVNDYIRTPSVTITEVIMEFSASHLGVATQRYFDVNGQWITRTSANIDTCSAGWGNIYIDDVLVTKATNFVPTNKRVTMRAVLNTATTGVCTIFADSVANLFLGGSLYSVKLYNAGILVAHYNMDTKTVLDQTTNTRHATLAGGTWLPTTIVTNGLIGYWNSKRGVKGNKWNNIAPVNEYLYNASLVNTTVLSKGMTFDNINDYIDFNVPPMTDTITPFTWEIRVKAENLIDVPSIIADGVGQYITYLSDNGAYFKVLIGDAYAQIAIPVALRTAERYLAFSYNPVNGLGKFYVNGVLIGTQGYLANQKFSNNGLFRLGGSYEATPQSWHFKGVLDNFRLYNRVLSDSEIISNYNIGSEVGLPPSSIIEKDSFNRADNATTLGTTDAGQVWKSYGTNNVWGIQNNQAYPITPVWDFPVYIDTGVSDNVAMQVTISTTHPQQQVYWRIINANKNYFCIQGNEVFQVTNNSWDNKGTISIANGDVFRVELAGNKHVISVNGIEKLTFFDESHMNGTKFGFSGNPSGPLLRYDNFLIENFSSPELVIPNVPATNIIEDFLDDTYNFAIAQGAKPWERLSAASIDGNLGHIRSTNNLQNSTESIITFTVLVPANTTRSWIEMDYAVDSEVDFDYLYIYLNGLEKFKISGLNKFGMFTTDLPAGTHKLKVRYYKDNNAESGTDRAYISGLRLFHENPTIVHDSFNRTDNTTTLGITDTGQVWQKYGTGVWGIQNNQAYPTTLNWDFPAYIETGVSDNFDFSVKYAVAHTSNQIMWRITSSLNFFVISGSNVRRVVNNTWVTLGTIPTLVNDDVIKIQVRGNVHTIFVNGIQRAQVTDSAHLTGTKVGFSTNSTTARIDDFIIRTV